MEHPDESGIYCIYWDQDPNKYYIGCSISIKNRIKNHLSDFNRNAHCNKKMQDYYNLYGKPNCEVLELCSSDIIFDKEIIYIEEFNSYKDGFNLTKGGNGRLFGEHANNAKYSYDTYKNILLDLAYTDLKYKDIAIKYTVTLDTIKHIARLSSHRYLEEDFPVECEILRNKLNNRDMSAKAKGIEYPPIVSPSGKIHVVDNVRKFAEDNGLQYQNLHKVLTGKRVHHKGWKLHT